MTRSSFARLGAALALTGVALAACGGATTSSSAPSAAVSTAPSTVAESPSASMEASPSESMAASPSDAAGSPAARTVQVQAVEGKLMNAPIDPLPGTVLTFRNFGKEAHEIVVLRRNDDATDKQTFDDLAKLDPASLMKFVTVVGVLAADPGQEAPGQIVLEQTGDYALVDLLAKGTTTAPASPDPMALPSGVPNVASGMFATFTVIAPEAS